PRLIWLLLLHRSAPTGPYALSLHDALPISGRLAHPVEAEGLADRVVEPGHSGQRPARSFGEIDEIAGDGHGLQNGDGAGLVRGRDRKSTRLNSSHLVISYAVFCLKKKKNRK